MVRDAELSPAIEAVLTRFAAMVRRVGLRHGLSETDVDEVFQEVRIRLWHARASPDSASEQISTVGSSYVYRTAVSAALDVIRRHRRARESSLEDSGDHSGEQYDDPESTLASSELARQVAQAIETIVPSRRPVVRMYLLGYSREEIADLLGWSEAKTRNLLYRGLADLRARLTEMGIGPEAMV